MYRLQLFGLPIRWRTEIVEWRPPFGFTDVQLSGPFRRWEQSPTALIRAALAEVSDRGSRVRCPVEGQARGPVLTRCRPPSSSPLRREDAGPAERAVCRTRRHEDGWAFRFVRVHRLLRRAHERCVDSCLHHVGGRDTGEGATHVDAAREGRARARIQITMYAARRDGRWPRTTAVHPARRRRRHSDRPRSCAVSRSVAQGAESRDRTVVRGGGWSPLAQPRPSLERGW